MPRPLPPDPPQPTAKVTASAHAPRTARVRQRPGIMTQVKIEDSVTVASHSHHSAKGFSGPGHRDLGVPDDAAVETVTNSAVGEEPRVAEEGDTEQVAPSGTPLQLNETDWLNPPVAVMLSEY